MATTKVYSKREVEKILKEHGWEFKKTKGSHRHFYNYDLRDTFVLPDSMNKMLTRRMLEERGLLDEDDIANKKGNNNEDNRSDL